MKKTRVVHCKKEYFDVLIDRTTKWGNPFKIVADGTRSEVIEKYRKWIKTRPELLEVLDELDGKVLGCWCKPNRCHGDILVELVNQRIRAKALKALFE